MPGLTLIFDSSETERITNFFATMERRLARSELLPILKQNFEPIVAEERSILSDHSRSGSLMSTLIARIGGGDRSGTMSVFSAPTARRRELKALWSQGRRQQRKWASKIQQSGRGRQSVFYGPFVEMGHRIVVRTKDGGLKDTGDRTDPVLFAHTAIETLGETQAESAAEAIIQHIIG